VLLDGFFRSRGGLFSLMGLIAFLGLWWIVDRRFSLIGCFNRIIEGPLGYVD
jgi:hypothetical protein